MRENKFDELYNALVEYRKIFGNVIVPQEYVIDGYPLGRRVSVVRDKYDSLKEEQKVKLNEIGFVWRIHQKKHYRHNFQEVLQLLQQYKEQYGNLDIPSNFVTENGIRLGAMVNSIRTKNRKISEEEMKQLNDIGFIWRGEKCKSFEKTYQLLLEYRETYGNLNIKQSYVSPDGRCLGRMVSYIRSGDRKLSKDQRESLDKIGFIWKKRYCFDDVYQMLKKYKEEYGICHIPIRYVTNNGVWLGRMLYLIRKGKRNLTNDQKEKLHELGFI
ncbi:MAG: helicase associated domain-containing protein [Clostridia bacterium]|nr:helicase associated domain-containing protein [Clostridia bacterium]